MKMEELKNALFNRRPIIAKIKSLGEVKYKCVEEIVYKRGRTLDRGRVICTAGLADYNGNSLTYVNASQIRYADEAEKNTAGATNTDCN